MIVYKCDYCGKIIDSPLKVSGLKFELKRITLPEVVSKFSSDQSFGLVFEHLCEDCAKLLTDKFLNLKNDILKERETIIGESKKEKTK